MSPDGPDESGAAGAATGRGGSFAIPTLIYAAAAGLAHLAGFRMDMGWSRYQLLDRQWLADAPGQALWLLHAQPPGLNALAAALLQIGGATGIPVEVAARCLFALAGWLGAVALFAIVRDVASSRWLAALGVVVLVSNPGFHFFAHQFFYPFWLQSLFLLWAWVALRFLRGGGWAPLVGAAATLAAISLIRAMYPPSWAVAMLLVLVAVRARWLGGDGWRAGLATALGLAAVLALWPSKNAAVFGQYTQSSWVGHNLTRRIAARSPERDALNRYIRDGSFPAAWQRRFEQRFPAASELQRRVLLDPVKSDGSRNWNHLAFVETNRPLTALGVRWRLDAPLRWLSQAIGYYAMWSRPTFAHPYEGSIRGPQSAAYRSYAAAWSWLPFADLRPLLERLAPDLPLHERARVFGRPVPYGLFALLFPALIGTAAVSVARRPADAAGALSGVLLLVLLWSVAVPCATDGIEGNRMRFATSPFELVCAGYLVGARRRPAAAPDRSADTGAGSR